MKWFMLLMMAGAAVAIFVYRDELRGTVDKNMSTKGASQSEEVVATGDEPVGGANSKPMQRTPGSSGTKGGSTATTPPVKPVKTLPGESEDDAIARRYPMPKFKSIEQAVGNWKSIPPSAFPRQITISKAVQIVLPGGVGSSTIPPKTLVFALASRGGVLTVGRTKEASVRGQIGIDDTDYKQILGKEFDRWKEGQHALVMKKRARYRNVLAQTRGNGKSRNESGLLEYEKELGKKPSQNSDGTVPLMVSSLRRGDVDEIKTDIIQRWGPVIREVVDGEAYWTSTVEYKTVSMFGELNTEAQALMRNGKVMQWVYTGSGESVP